MAAPAATFKAERPDSISMVLTVTLTLGEWRTVHNAIEASGEHTHYGPLGVVCQAIRSMTSQAERVWKPEGPEGA